MLNKSQIKKRIESMLDHKEVCNKLWFVEQLESLLSSMYSPEKFEASKETHYFTVAEAREKLKESGEVRNVYPCGER